MIHFLLHKGGIGISVISEYKAYLWDYLSTYHNLKNPKQFFHCLNPEHNDNNPSMMFTDKYNICKCFACGTSYDIYDIIGLDYNLTDFREQLSKVKEIYLGYKPTYNNEYKEQEYKLYDYTNYYNKCIKNISKTNYLQNRGITNNLVNKYKIGYDEERNMVVFPINKNCYFARSTVNNDKRKNKGKSEIWNRTYLKNSDNKTLIYITEGIIDSLSLEVIDPNIKTISINGVGNINQFVNTIKEDNFKGHIVITFDNDKAGIDASKILKEELAKINVNSFSNTLISNFGADECKDLNSALLIDKDKLKKNYDYANTVYKNYINDLYKESEVLEQ